MYNYRLYGFTRHGWEYLETLEEEEEIEEYCSDLVKTDVDRVMVIRHDYERNMDECYKRVAIDRPLVRSRKHKDDGRRV